MRILLLNYARLSAMKGTERFFLTIGNYLTDMGHDVFYVGATNCSYRGLEKPAQVKFRVIEIPFLKIGYEYILHVPIREIRKIRPDVIYIHTFALYPLLPMTSYRFILGTLTFGPEDFLSYGGKLSSKFKAYSFFIRSAAKFLYHRERTIIHVLNSTQEEWIRSMGFDGFEIREIPLPIDCGTCKAEPELWERSEKFQVLYLGGVDKSKGILTFLDIISAVNELGFAKQIEFIIAGTGLYVGLVEMIAKSTANVLYLGIVSDSEKTILLNTVSVLVSPSKNENFHLVSAESQICGLPVISSDLSGPRSIIADGTTGRLIKNDSVPDFVSAIIEYYDLWKTDRCHYSRIRSKISERATRFCSEKVLPDLLRLFTDVGNH